MGNMKTMSEVMNILKERGYTANLKIKSDSIICVDSKKCMKVNEFEIDKSYRFEGDSDADYQSILYAISSDNHNIKGLLVNGYGIYADDIANELIDKLHFIHD